MTPFEAWSGHKPHVTHFKIFGSRAWARIPTEKRKALQPQSQECLFVGYSKDSKGYKLINLSMNKSFIERCVQFQEEPLAVVEVGESSSPREPLNVSEEIVEHADSDISDNDYLIADPNSPTRPKWAAKTIHAAGNPNDPRRTRSQFESALCVKDPLFVEKCYLMVESDPQTYEYAANDPRWQASMKEEFSSLQQSNTWELVDLPLGRKLVQCKWVYKPSLMLMVHL